MRILGIDPGSHATGWGVIEARRSSLRWVASGVIRPPTGTLGERLAAVHRELAELVVQHSPESAALEAVFTHRNPRSALLLGHARGTALVVCSLAGLPAAEYPPARVKSAVSGYGRAEKGQVQLMVQRLLALERSLRADEADALAVAICHSLEQRSPAGARRSGARTLGGVAAAAARRPV